MQNVELGIIAFSIALSFGCCGVYSFRIYRIIAKTPTSPIGDLSGGVREIKGRVASTKEKLKSPLTNTGCVYYRFLVTEKRQRNAIVIGERYGRVIINDTQRMRFSVRDSSGEVKIEVSGVKFLLDVDKHTTTGMFNSASGKLENTLQERYGESSRGMIFNRSLSYKETILKPGDRVYVLGHVTGGEELRFARKFGVPYIVSDSSETSLTRRYQSYTWLFWAFAILLFIFTADILTG